MQKGFGSLWHDPHKIEKKSRISSFYLTIPEGRKLSLHIDGSLLKPYHLEGT
jgi:hypothetical protein